MVEGLTDGPARSCLAPLRYWVGRWKRCWKRLKIEEHLLTLRPLRICHQMQISLQGLGQFHIGVAIAFICMFNHFLGYGITFGLSMVSRVALWFQQLPMFDVCQCWIRNTCKQKVFFGAVSFRGLVEIPSLCTEYQTLNGGARGGDQDSELGILDSEMTTWEEQSVSKEPPTKRNISTHHQKEVLGLSSVVLPPPVKHLETVPSRNGSRAPSRARRPSEPSWRWPWRTAVPRMAWCTCPGSRFRGWIFGSLSFFCWGKGTKKSWMNSLANYILY